MVGEPKCTQGEKYSNESELFIFNGTTIGSDPSTSLLTDISGEKFLAWLTGISAACDAKE